MDPTLPLCLARWNLQAAPIFLGDGKFDIPEVPVQNRPFFYHEILLSDIRLVFHITSP